MFHILLYMSEYCQSFAALFSSIWVTPVFRSVPQRLAYLPSTLSLPFSASPTPSEILNNVIVFYYCFLGLFLIKYILGKCGIHWLWLSSYWPSCVWGWMGSSIDDFIQSNVILGKIKLSQFHCFISTSICYLLPQTVWRNDWTKVSFMSVCCFLMLMLVEIILKPTDRCNYLLKYIITSYPIGIVGWIFCGASTTWWNCI